MVAEAADVGAAARECCSGCRKALMAQTTEVVQAMRGRVPTPRVYCTACIEKVCTRCGQGPREKIFGREQFTMTEAVCKDCETTVCCACANTKTRLSAERPATDAPIMCRTCEAKRCKHCGESARGKMFTQRQMRRKEPLCHECEQAPSDGMLMCYQRLLQEPSVSFRYYRAMPAGKVKTLCDQYMKRAPNRWLQCPGCACKGRLPYRAREDYSECPPSYLSKHTARIRCNTCRRKKKEEEHEQTRKRLQEVAPHK